MRDEIVKPFTNMYTHTHTFQSQYYFKTVLYKKLIYTKAAIY